MQRTWPPWATTGFAITRRWLPDRANSGRIPSRWLCLQALQIMSGPRAVRNRSLNMSSDWSVPASSS